MKNAQEIVAASVLGGAFKSLVVTSRQGPRAGRTKERFSMIKAIPLTLDHLGLFVETYAPIERREEVLDKIALFVGDDERLSPLFVRFAIEQVLKTETVATNPQDLVAQHVGELRRDRVDLDPNDMLRAALIAAREAMRRGSAPHEISSDYLSGVMQLIADKHPFRDSGHTRDIDPAELINILVSCGLLNRNPTNRKLQFAYDPVAEILIECLEEDHDPQRKLAS